MSMSDNAGAFDQLVRFLNKDNIFATYVLTIQPSRIKLSVMIYKNSEMTIDILVEFAKDLGFDLIHFDNLSQQMIFAQPVIIEKADI